MVLVKPTLIEKTSASGLIVIPPTEEEKMQMAQYLGEVVDIGPIAWQRECYGLPEVIPRCKVGDTVFFRRYSGEEQKGEDGIKYRIINDQDIFGVKT